MVVAEWKHSYSCFCHYWNLLCREWKGFLLKYILISRKRILSTGTQWFLNACCEPNSRPSASLALTAYYILKKYIIINYIGDLEKEKEFKQHAQGYSASTWWKECKTQVVQLQNARFHVWLHSFFFSASLTWDLLQLMYKWYRDSVTEMIQTISIAKNIYVILRIFISYSVESTKSLHILPQIQYHLPIFTIGITRLIAYFTQLLLHQ